MQTNKLIVVLLIVALIVIGVLGYLFWKSRNSDESASSKTWSAVFLTNGQVYFGQLENITDQYVKLTSIYYLQVQKAIQPKTDETSKDDESKISLVKLGNELHGPTDQMNINRDQVLFWEELKSDSKVVKAIEKYEEEKK